MLQDRLPEEMLAYATESPAREGGMGRLALLGERVPRGLQSAASSHVSHTVGIRSSWLPQGAGAGGPRPLARSKTEALSLVLPPPALPAGVGSGSAPHLTGFGHGLCL